MMTSVIRCRLALAAFVVATGAMVVPVAVSANAGPDIHALVVGIDAYPSSELRLLGAVNDANDMAALARELDARSVRVLLNKQAHREAVISGWRQMLAGAKPGDTLLFTFAGHGRQLPERTPGMEDDGMEEAIVLLSADGEHEENLFDQELRELITEAREFNVVVVFDSCHSGTLTRAPIPESQLLPVRGTNVDYSSVASLPGASVSRQRSIQPNETYFGATMDALKVREVWIDGKPRGALTAYFTRGIRGAADTSDGGNGDGQVDRGEIKRYLEANVPMNTDGQRPAINFLVDGNTQLFRSVPGRPVQAGPLRLAVKGSLPDGWRLTGVRHVPEVEAELVWDAGSRRITRHGDPVCQASSAETLQGEIDRWRALAHLRALAEKRSFVTGLSSGDRSYCNGEAVTFHARPGRDARAVLVNFECGGKVAPLSGVHVQGDGGSQWQTSLRVQPPFGSEQLVFVAADSTEAAVALRSALEQFSDQRASLEAVEKIAEHVSKPGFSLAIQGLYTTADCPNKP
jgi:hypothetical protein